VVRLRIKGVHLHFLVVLFLLNRPLIVRRLFGALSSHCHDAYYVDFLDNQLQIGVFGTFLIDFLKIPKYLRYIEHGN